MLRIIIFFSSLLLTSNGWGQYAMGMIEEDDNYNNLVKPISIEDGAKSILATTKKIDLTPFCPIPQDQKTISSCVGWAVGYAAFSTQLAIQNNWYGQKDKITEHAMSALFIYNQIKVKDCESGAKIIDALELLANVGDIPAYLYDEDVENCTTLPSSTQLKQAENYQIKEYVKLFETEATEAVKIKATKYSLIQRKPVLIGMNLLENFKSATTYWRPNQGNMNYLGGHAMCVVGFDDERKAFRLMNSWGTGWGNEGFIWIKYEDFAKYCKYGLQFTIKTSGVIPSYSGQFAISYPKWENGKLNFTDCEAIFNGVFYEVQKPWKLGELFQLAVNQLTSGGYLYAFTYDPTGEIVFHYPRDFALNEYRDTHQLMEENLTIPSPNTALELNKRGTEYLCLLYSREPIANLQARLQELTYLEGDFSFKFRKIFKNRLVPFNKNYFQKKDATFHIDYLNGILPIIFRFQTF